MCGESRTHGVERGKRWKAVLTHRSDLTYRYHDEENRPTLMTFGDNQTVTYTYDGLGRVSERSANAGGTAVTRRTPIWTVHMAATARRRSFAR